jgi:hypothetical protein
VGLIVASHAIKNQKAHVRFRHAGDTGNMVVLIKKKKKENTSDQGTRKCMSRNVTESCDNSERWAN